MSSKEKQINLFRNVNQIQIIGSEQPPNMNSISDKTLSAASPINFDLINTTKISQNVSDQALNSCRQYKDIEGIRKLQEVQKNRSYYDAGCGWIFKPSNGINPEINQGALGTHSGPTRDTLPSGAKWFWDLDEAEKEITQKICNNATKCKHLTNLGRFSEICGYCKSTGTIIPVVRNGNAFSARYPNDSSLMCKNDDIVTSSSGSCPAEGFSDYAGSELQLGLQSKNSMEGFVTLDDIDSCKPPLSRDCVVLAARLAGCSDKGTLIKALQSEPPTGPYENQLRQKMAFNAYQGAANPNITSQMLKDGSTSINTALDDFGRLIQNTTTNNDKLRLAARDLCLNSGEYETYDFCKEITENTVINKDYITCVQNDWKENGGTEQGLEYPTLTKYNGKRWKDYIEQRNTIRRNIQSTNKEINSLALKQFLGINTMEQINSANEIVRDETTRGAETVWIDIINHATGQETPIIIKCDLKLAKDGPIYPEFRDKQTMSALNNVPQDNIAFTTAFELRPDLDTSVSYQVTTDDGFMLSMNQNPFENTNNRGNDWGSWRYQAPTTYQSRNYMIQGAKKNGTNTFVTKWFHGNALAVHALYPRINGKILNQSMNAGDRKDIYLTQEPLAPWLQFELCERPNLNERNRLGFFEKRWNGPAAYASQGGRAIPSFDVYSKSVAFNSKEKCITFMRSSSWHTASKFAYTAFRTITLCVRPRPTLASGERGVIFTHANIGGLDIGVVLTNKGGNYVFSMWNGRNWTEVPAVLNEWNFIVIQYVGDRNGIRNITIHADTMSNLQNTSRRSNFFRSLLSTQSATGSIIVSDPIQNRRNAGYLVLGSVAPTMKDINNNPVRVGLPSFTGDVKWIHGFRNFLDTEKLLTTEIQQTWISRWPRDMK